ncbi:ribosomal protein S6 kinase alpha-2 [Plectosphaerella plurivora]|uniref:Ribosomal protein S6 kinase alpha-2 n=1 Tax=Plectosphaerella plurivora TaxID=936078 RepID=A0A9P8V3U9_9PEZI|nr:ribosomal protein S6 kinase alpha-2 [Plectosphaerella plurivora]
MRNQFAGFSYNRPIVTDPDVIERRREEELRNKIVPCQWPDDPKSAPAVDANGHVQPPSEPTDQVEHGTLRIHIKFLRFNIPGSWKLRAILEHDGSLTDTEFDVEKWPPLAVGKGADPLFLLDNNSVFQTDMSLRGQPCEAVLHLLLERHTVSNSPPGDDTATVLDLGFISLGPFTEPCTMQMMKYSPSMNTAVQIHMEVAFSRAKLPGFKSDSWKYAMSKDGQSDFGGLKLVKVTDTPDSYLMANVCAEDYRKGSATFSLENPWILPVRFSYKSSGRLHLLTPLSSSRHLLDHVQKCHRMTEKRAQIYAEQLVCALESLHDLGVVALLSTENVLLDVLGNIRIVTPRLFTTDQSFALDQLTYPAPELLSGDEPSQLTDWWMLGAFLYEILTGLPPFHHQDSAERDRKTLTEELDVPAHVQAVTADFLRRLLDKNPTQRLGGVHGVSEIKKHDFLLGVDWQHPNATCSDLSPYHPGKANYIFEKSPERASITPPRVFRELGGLIYKESCLDDDSKSERIVGRLRSSSDIFNSDLSLYDRLGKIQAAANNLRADSELQGGEPETVMARLKAALQTEQITEEKVAHVLDGCASDDVLTTVLASPILLVNITPINTITPPKLKCEVPITALEWAVELGREDLVLLLLDRGADANHTFDERYSPALTRAARERRTQLVDILVPKTSRTFAIRTLCLAVEQRDIPTVTCLLSHGVPCDFEAADHPLAPPKDSCINFNYCCGYGDMYPTILEWHFAVPPIVRAVRHDDVAMWDALMSTIKAY